MPNTITIRKGLDIPMDGVAELRLTDAQSITTYAVKPTDFVGLMPRLVVEEGDNVRAGDTLFVDKRDERIRFTSPANGRVKAIVRGEKRRLLEVVVEADGKTSLKSSVFDIPKTAEEIKSVMLQCGLWTMLRQRPFGTIAHPDDKPKAIFVSAFDSAPLAPDYDFALQGREMFFAKGIEALTLLTEGLVHICFRPDQRLSNVVGEGRHMVLSLRVETHYIKGPHPSGNVGTQIAKIDPINKGEVVWTMNAQDVAVLGELVTTGVYRPEKVIAVVGPQTKNPHYYRIWSGACMESIVAAQMPNGDFPKMESSATNYRVISGNVLSGMQIATKGFIGAYDNMITLLPEGNQPEFMGWLMPGFKKFSFSRTFLSGFLPKSTFKPFGMQPPRFERFWKYDTNFHGEERPFVVTGEFEKVFPFDIYPLQLIKACLVGDLDLMENLGIYEVEPEDFALCEFVDTSKTDIQTIIRNGLELARKENEQ